MESVSVPRREYWAFISYRHSDNREEGRRWATWLHQAIESYRVPPDLVGKSNPVDHSIPEKIFPVFRDEEELPADADLSSPIYRALDQSKYLIVLCSPRAVASLYVANEIAYFKKLGRADRILAVILDGEPNVSWDHQKLAQGFSPDEECFPAPLRHEIDSEGEALEHTHTEPIAADVRILDESKPRLGWTSSEAYRLDLEARGGIDRKEISARVTNYETQLERAKLKVIAGILGVPLGDLTKRDEAYQLREERKRAKRLRRWLGTVAILSVLAVASGIFAWHQRSQAVSSDQRTSQTLSRTLADQGFLKGMDGEYGEAIATMAAGLREWPGNEVVSDQLMMVLTIRDWLLPHHRFPAPPQGTGLLTAQAMATENQLFDDYDGRRKPWSMFDSGQDRILYFSPIDGDSSRVEVAALSLQPGAQWEPQGTAPPPPDGHSFGGKRLISLNETEGSPINSTLYVVDERGEQTPLQVTQWDGRKVNTIGLGSISNDGKLVAFVGGLREPDGSFLNREPALYVVDGSSGEILSFSDLPPPGDYQIYVVRIVGHFVVAQHYSLKNRNWRTGIFDISDPRMVRPVIDRQLLPGLIDDFNPNTGEFLVRGDSDLATYRLFRSPDAEEIPWDRSIHLVEGVSHSDGWSPKDLEVQSPDDQRRAHLSPTGEVQILENAKPDALPKTFYLDVDFALEGGRFLQRAFFIPNSPYLGLGYGVRSDLSFQWECWDYQRGKLAFRAPHFESKQLIGCSPNGRFLVFDQKPYPGPDESPGDLVARGIRYPSPSDPTPLDLLAELCGGTQWTENSLEQLDSDGYFSRRDALVQRPCPTDDFGSWLMPWVEFLRTP